ncbi:MAG TPA: sugar ABC transporter permease [Stellaceae bacterium]|jgi:multiple sugar transport system permease protein|nr:sugar ABC transporter permease [Stellaceae bacterium]
MPGRAASPSLRRQRRRFLVLCLAPALAVLMVVTLAPTLYLVVTSLTPLNLTNPATQWNFSVPWANYALLIHDERFLNSLWVQAKLSFWTVGLQLLIGIGFALLLNIRSGLIRALRTVFLIPMVLPPIVVAIIWKVLYTPDISPAHQLLKAMGWPVPSLITDPNWALPAIIIADTWEWFPLTMLMVMAALQTIPEELLDAAQVDGANRWQTGRHVILPSIRGTVMVAALFRLIDSIKAFPLIYLLTDGGPGSVTEVTNYYAFQQAFNFSYLGFSSAITVVLVAATLLLSWWIVYTTGWGNAE